MITAAFRSEKATKNTIRFQEIVADGEYPAIGTLYIQKPVVSKLGNPDKIKVTVEKESQGAGQV